ncbi:DUF3224 domain-containing protein [Brevundimonas sp. NIBR11]|uniref:DUF3224 domain-containing protein n=1 Tax=Brevundimonas sp. NIBR11 TaxID=3015999 RepID=UPI0022F03252|nr:DUF3224 domain-containing protein [Brevundimonas sp. NIBR11]WGM30932.1 hypothetical protein KKHFBJBL_01166 [Brevundimonas sp. NIBR11]
MRTLTFRGYLAVAVIGLMVAVLWMAAGTVRAQEAVMRHATGTFEVSVTPADPEVREAGLGLARFMLAKTFTGGMSGACVGQMLAGGPSEQVGTYVALERFVGTVNGRNGAFLMAHRGDMSAEGYSLSITIVPGSGTGELKGIGGDFALVVEGGEHRYDLSYSLPVE